MRVRRRQQMRGNPALMAHARTHNFPPEFFFNEKKRNRCYYLEVLSRKVVTMLRIKMLYCVSRDSADYISGASSRNLPFLVGAMINEQLNATQNDVGFPYRVSHFSAPHSHHICCLIDLRIEGELCSRALQLEVN